MTKEYLETLYDYDSCPVNTHGGCGAVVAEWMFKHYTDNSVESICLCICHA